MLKLDSLRVDLKARVDGQWQDTRWPVKPGESKRVRMLVRSIEYAPYKQERDAQFQRLAQQYVSGAPDDVVMPLLGRLLADHILLGWDGFDPDYSEDVARETLMRMDGSLLRTEVVELAQRVGIRELEFVAELEKNSAPPSDTN